MPHGKSPTTPRKAHRGKWLHVSSPCALVPHPSGALGENGEPIMTVAVVKGKGHTYNKREAYEAAKKERAEAAARSIDPGDRTNAFRND